MQCSRCRSENEDSAKFCASCGSPMRVAPPPVCPVCAHVNAAGANFCVACGSHLRRRAVTPQASAPDTVARSAAAAGAEASTRPASSAPAAAVGRNASAHPLSERTGMAGMPRPDIAAAAVRPEDFEGAAISPPRISGFELKAGLAVLILVLGGGLLWWSSQNDSRLAELALTAATPGSSALRPVANITSKNTAPPPLPETRAQKETVAVAPPLPAAEPTPAPAPAAVPAVAPASEAPPAPKAKPSRHKTKRQHVETKEEVPIIERSTPAADAVVQSAPPPAEKRRPNMREQVAACHRLQLFEGERCLWRICDGKWGKDGCPSYN